MSGFLLSLLSPVWHRTLTHAFSNGRKLRIEFEEDEEKALKTMVILGCGGGQVTTRGLNDLLEVGRVADKYQVDEAKRAVEEEAVRHLKLEICGKLLTASESSGLQEIERACRRMGLARFEELTKTEGFMGMGEEMLGSLLKDDRLECGSEDGETVASAMAGVKTALEMQNKILIKILSAMTKAQCKSPAPTTPVANEDLPA